MGGMPTMIRWLDIDAHLSYDYVPGMRIVGVDLSSQLYEATSTTFVILAFLLVASRSVPSSGMEIVILSGMSCAMLMMNCHLVMNSMCQTLGCLAGSSIDRNLYTH